MCSPDINCTVLLSCSWKTWKYSSGDLK